MSRFARTPLLIGVVVGLAWASPVAAKSAVPAGGRYEPPTRQAGTTAVLPITLPDGTRAELRYPRKAHLAELGFGTIGSVQWDVSSDPQRCCGRVLQIQRMTVKDQYGSFKPIKTFDGANGERIRYYDVGTPLRYLVFQFGPWMVSVYNVKDPKPSDFEVEMNDEQLATWARSLSGRVDKHGYLVLRAKKPLRIETLVDFVFGTREQNGNFVEIASQYCGMPESDAAEHREFAGGVAWCDPKTDWHVSVEGDPGFVRLVSDGLKIRRLS